MYRVLNTLLAQNLKKLIEIWKLVISSKYDIAVKFCEFSLFLLQEDYLHNFFMLSHFMPLISVGNPWKHQKVPDFLMLSGGIERDQ